MKKMIARFSLFFVFTFTVYGSVLDTLKVSNTQLSFNNGQGELFITKGHIGGDLFKLPLSDVLFPIYQLEGNTHIKILEQNPLMLGKELHNNLLDFDILGLEGLDLDYDILSSNIVIQIKKLKIKYGGHHLIHNLSLRCPRPERLRDILDICLTKGVLKVGSADIAGIPFGIIQNIKLNFLEDDKFSFSGQGRVSGVTKFVSGKGFYTASFEKRRAVIKITHLGSRLVPTRVLFSAMNTIVRRLQFKNYTVDPSNYLIFDVSKNIPEKLY